MYVQRKRRACSAVWPIDEKAGNPPQGWTGWPEGKKFALVLTHDVETVKGQDNCRKLAELEMESGFHSCFNFVPERHKVSKELRHYLTDNGFEVGVHGLYHDGKLYKSKKTFQKRAIKINHYLKEWNSVGFRSPSMHNNLDWIHGLNIEYDSSTFDTDPFEPQSEGMKTIFPFLVTSNLTHNSYIELPYTLPQDSTLFLFMRENTIDIWKRKLDWIVEKGGMVLLNTHPDYMNLGEKKRNIEEYPIEYYVELLKYIKKRYKDQYWHVLPKHMAGFCKMQSTNLREIITNKKCQEKGSDKGMKKFCMVAYTNYESDNRVIRYAESLARRGGQVDVICLGVKDQPRYDKVNGVGVFRVQKRSHKETSKYMYLFKIILFYIKASTVLTGKYVFKKYDMIHIHNIPDFLVFTAFIPKIAGSKIILDIHDIVPEFYVDKFKVGNNSLTYKLLVMVERLSAAFADHVIVSNDLWRSKLITRSVDEGKCTTILNYPNSSVFFKREKKKRKDKFLIMYPGTLNWHQGLDIAIKAFGIICDNIPELEFHIRGGGVQVGELMELVAHLKLEERIFFKDYLPVEENANCMATADLGIVPKRADGFGNEAFSTKIFEFMGLGVPVIASNTKIDQFYFDESLVSFFKSGDERDLGEKIFLLVKDKVLRDQLVENSLKYMESNCWEVKENIYLNIVDKLVGNYKN
ncbi:glycosyl transferase group 1 [Candidatus Scalindua japonica]|uniref:Glycosyl transferase group 1 n=2 Tax=Candidatus Scalindua japonica TaxID=1284222 RepID=A0A286TZD2_9BACT|nr:glycosyl transferase group 1 [Candidatus Scalindua japonica]